MKYETFKKSLRSVTFTTRHSAAFTKTILNKILHQDFSKYCSLYVDEGHFENSKVKTEGICLLVQVFLKFFEIRSIKNDHSSQIAREERMWLSVFCSILVSESAVFEESFGV